MTVKNISKELEMTIYNETAMKKTIMAINTNDFYGLTSMFKHLLKYKYALVWSAYILTAKTNLEHKYKLFKMHFYKT